MCQLVVIHHIILSNFNEGTRMTIPTYVSEHIQSF